MRLAYLMLVHDQPAHVARLVDALDDALDDHSVDFFIHVDGKARFADFQWILSGRANVHFVERGNIYWADFSMVKAELRLLEAATRAVPAFDRYCMISGADYPIQSREAIRRTFTDSDRELIRVKYKLTGVGSNGDAGFVERYHFRADHLERAARSPVQQRLARRYLDLLDFINDRLAPRARTPGFDYYKGSQWWCLTHACVRYVLAFLEQNPHVLRTLRFAFVPEEILFQSIVKASPFADRIAQDFERGPDESDVHGCHYVNWHDPVSVPKVLDEKDLPVLLASPALFARKMSEGHSARLLDALDAHRSKRDMAEEPPVSCVCLTYGRPELLEEAIHSFLRQDYPGPKELLVLNDYEAHTLHFAHPEVRVVNLPRRLRTVGEKMNAAVALCRHDLLFVWDDDDIYLPHRISASVRRFDPRRGFFKPQRAWMLDNGVLTLEDDSLFHVGSCWSRRVFDAVGGYPAEGTGYDLIFEERLRRRFSGSIAPSDVEPTEITYIYRWNGTGSYHMSNFGELRVGGNVGHDGSDAFVRERASRGQIRTGAVALVPRWREDYQRLVADHLAGLRK
jgi:hypothetical protein